MDDFLRYRQRYVYVHVVGGDCKHRAAHDVGRVRRILGKHSVGGQPVSIGVDLLSARFRETLRPVQPQMDVFGRVYRIRRGGVARRGFGQFGNDAFRARGAGAWIFGDDGHLAGSYRAGVSRRVARQGLWRHRRGGGQRYARRTRRGRRADSNVGLAVRVLGVYSRLYFGRLARNLFNSAV